MAILADEHMTDEPRGGRGNLFSKFARSIGLSGGRGFMRTAGLEQITRMRTSALARRIIVFNLIALCILLVGMLFVNQFKGEVATEKQASMVVEAQLYSDLVAGRMQGEAAVGAALLDDLPIADGLIARVFAADGTVVAQSNGAAFDNRSGSGFISKLSGVLSFLPGMSAKPSEASSMQEPEFAAGIAQSVISEQAQISKLSTLAGGLVLSVGQSVPVDGGSTALVLTSQPGFIDSLMASEQKSIFQLFLLAVVVSVLLSLALANTIANPIHDLARAAEAGTTKEGRQEDASRVRIPDLSGRPDEIGRLSRAMRDMTSALYDRIDTNEEFAADVAHEIKNPLASLRSAVETLRIAPEGDGRIRLLDVIEHDVRRLDRLVSDISNASRLDAELVKEEEEEFDLTLMLSRIADFHTHEAKDKGVELIWAEPEKPIMFDGMEARLAQVFVNLISNAISFCGDGDAVRVWAREKDNRVLIVVEDTGPGIPEEALTKVFKRFYSERPEHDYGNNSGLGLSISKQIVEAHKGVIWAENIHSRDAKEGDAPLGARFVVGLPV